MEFEEKDDWCTITHEDYTTHNPHNDHHYHTSLLRGERIHMTIDDVGLVIDPNTTHHGRVLVTNHRVRFLLRDDDESVNVPLADIASLDDGGLIEGRHMLSIACRNIRRIRLAFPHAPRSFGNHLAGMRFPEIVIEFAKLHHDPNGYTC